MGEYMAAQMDRQIDGAISTNKIAQGDSDLNYSGLLHIADKIRKGEF